MSTSKRKFTKDFKLEAVNMVVDGGLPKSEVARRLDISPATIGNWVKCFQEDGAVAFPGNGKLKPEDEKVRRLERENRDLREQNEFLKKTSAFFASLKK